MKVLFLDIDGVLNNHDFNQDSLSGTIHKDKMELLNKVLKLTDSKIVISSAWRYLIHRGEVTLEGFEWLMRTHGLLRDRVVGYTRKDSLEVRMGPWDGNPETWPVENERGQEIADWIELHSVSQYAVVDDLDLGIRGRHPFVQTDGKIGLTATNAFDLIGLLS